MERESEEAFEERMAEREAARMRKAARSKSNTVRNTLIGAGMLAAAGAGIVGKHILTKPEDTPRKPIATVPGNYNGGYGTHVTSIGEEQTSLPPKQYYTMYDPTLNKPEASIENVASNRVIMREMIATVERERAFLSEPNEVERNEELLAKLRAVEISLQSGEANEATQTSFHDAQVSFHSTVPINGYVSNEILLGQVIESPASYPTYRREAFDEVFESKELIADEIQHMRNLRAHLEARDTTFTAQLDSNSVSTRLQTAMDCERLLAAAEKALQSGIPLTASQCETLRAKLISLHSN